MEGIELIKRREKKIRLDLSLPPLFTAFINNYAIGKEGLKREYVKYNEDLIHLSSLTYFGENEYENSISHLLDQTELLLELNKFKKREDDYHNQGFIKVGYFDINDSILLCVDGDSKDTIWKLNGDWGDERPYKEKLANNIFEFANCLKEVIIEMNLLVRGLDKAKLYKKWGEEFWRVLDVSHEA